MAQLDDEQLIDERMKILAQERKGFFETTQQQVKQNKETIQQLRTENQELKAIVAAGKRGPGMVQQLELTPLDRTICSLTLQLDRSRAEEKEKLHVARSEQAKLEDVAVTSQPLLTEESLLTRRIRMLENRLDRSLIKYNEALSIKRTYEEIVRRLREERVGFDNQLAAIERTLRAKNHDYQELLKMSHAANHAKESAKRELQQFKSAFDEERRTKDRELSERKSYVQAKVDQTQKLERREKSLRMEEADEARRRAEGGTDDIGHGKRGGAASSNSATRGGTERSAEEDARLSKYEAAFKAMKDATGVSDVQEVLQRFLSHEDTHRNLVAMSQEAQSRVDQLKAEKAELASRLEDLRYSGSGQLGSRRIVEEFEIHLAEAENTMRLRRSRYEELTMLLISIKAGVEHLAENLASYRTDLAVPLLADDEATVDVLRVCEQKLASLADDVSPAELAVIEAADGALHRGGGGAAAAAGMSLDMSAHNRRVKLPRDEDGEDDDDGVAGAHHGGAGADDAGDDDAVLKRDQVKKIAANAIQREQKKLKRKKKDR